MAKRAFVFSGALAVVAMLVFSDACQAYTENKLYSFCSAESCKDGSDPNGLVIDPSGNLFGVTYSGGRFGGGTVFEFVPSTSQYVVLHDFCSKTGCADGSNPGRVSLVIDVNDNLYGTTTKGGNVKHPGGVVFELMRTNSGWHDVTLYKFCGYKSCADGSESPLDGLTYAGAASGQLYDGKSPLYGTTQYGGTNYGGTVFALTPQSGSKEWSKQVVYGFCSQTNCADGEFPDTPLYIDAHGNIYGTTPYGGQSNQGVVFELTPNGSNYSESVAYSFCQQANCTDGASPYGGVIMDAQGDLYGPDGNGGANNDGLIFKLTPNGTQWQFADVADFDGTNGDGPVGPLILDTNGNLFGTTYRGGTNLGGTVFAFNGAIQSLYSFCKKCVGSTVGVVEDTVGNLYGVTPQGGDNGKGTLYELSP